MGQRFELRIDHCGLNHLFGQPTLNARQTKWLEFLSEYGFEIKHTMLALFLLIIVLIPPCWLVLVIWTVNDGY